MKIEGLRLWLAGTNVWIVAPEGPGGECVLIDAPPEPRVILHRLRENGLRLVALLTTHGHVDHVGGIGEVVAHAHDGMDPSGPVPIHLHDGDRHMLLDPVGTGGTLAQMLDMENLRIPPPEIVFGLDDGQKVSGGGMTFTALHTPGHTQGSVCFLLEMEGSRPACSAATTSSPARSAAPTSPAAPTSSSWCRWRRRSSPCPTTWRSSPATVRPPPWATNAAPTPSSSGSSAPGRRRERRSS